MESIDQLIDIHARLQSGRGRRHRQEAIHRAGVVLIVAAWQAYIEKISRQALAAIERSIAVDETGAATPAWARASFKFRKPAVAKAIGDLNTPNSSNVQRLFDNAFGFDPRPHWIWDAPRRNWAPSEFCLHTDEWLRIRHTIAHGNNLPDNLVWIRSPSGVPRLTLSLLKECKRHFREMARRTDLAFLRFLRRQYSIHRREMN